MIILQNRNCIKIDSMEFLRIFINKITRIAFFIVDFYELKS